jgi:tol-pal system protein YbgF
MLKQLVLCAAILAVAVTDAFAQARIVDSEPVGESDSIDVSNDTSSYPAETQAVGLSTGNPQAELYNQVQLLQIEVQELRGIVEEQQNEVKRLKQQRLDDYIDLDRRLSQLTGSPPKNLLDPSAQAPSSMNAPGNSAVLSPPISPAPPAPADVPPDEWTSYSEAMNLVIKMQDFDGGIVALKNYLQQFPNGKYAANAKFWLGQVYLKKEDYTESKNWLLAMINDHADHAKVPEAKFKLATAFFSLGEKEKARVLLQEVVATNTPVAGLAQDYLNQNF